MAQEQVIPEERLAELDNMAQAALAVIADDDSRDPSIRAALFGLTDLVAAVRRAQAVPVPSGVSMMLTGWALNSEADLEEAPGVEWRTHVRSGRPDALTLTGGIVSASSTIPLSDLGKSKTVRVTLEPAE